MGRRQLSDHAPTRPVASPDPTDTHRWREHVWFARIIRLLVLLVPLVVSFVIALWLGSIIPIPASLGGRIARWVGIAAASTAVLLPLQRLMRRLLPLSALFSLTLVFPDEAPSRFGLALRSASVRDLDRALREIEPDPDTEPHQHTAEQLLVLVAALSRHDRLTRGHSERVRAYTILIAQEMGLDPQEIDRLRWAGLLHDIGKLHVPAEILNKPGALTDEEYAVIKTHPERGAALTASLAPWLGDSVLAVIQHHEQWAGGGYPYGIAGREITQAGRIVAVADAFDVMTSARSYKPPIPARAARAELERCAGTQFDPDVVRGMLGISIGHLWKAMGPVSWIAQLRMFPRQATQGGTVLATTAAVTAAMAVTALAAGVADPPQRRSEAPVAAAPEVLEPADEVASEPPAPDPTDPPATDPPATDPASTSTSSTTTSSTTSTTSTTSTIVPFPTVAYVPPYVPPVTVRPATTTTSTAPTTTTAPATTTTAVASLPAATTSSTTSTTAAPTTTAAPAAVPEDTTAPETTTAPATTTTTTVPDTTTTSTTTTTTTTTTTSTTTTTTTVPSFTRLLLASSAPGDVDAQPILHLDPVRPTQNAVLANYDADRNADPGLTIEQSTDWLLSTDPRQVQVWAFPGGETELPATVNAVFYVAPASVPAAGDSLHVRAGIFRCNAPRTSCTRLRALTVEIPNPANGFRAVTFDLSDPTADNVPGGLSLELRFAVPSTSDLDAWVAYDAAPYPASIVLGP